MNKLTDKKQIRRLTALFALTYMISYMTRINYGAVISEMEKVSGISKAMLSMALTGSFITYGIGQVISGICGDRFSPKKLLGVGLLTTILMNFMILFCQNPWQMLAVWCVNGFAQAFMWPPLVKLMTTFFYEEDYKKASVEVSRGSSYGTIAVYFLSPVMILLSGWKSVFFVSAVCGVVMLFLWQRFCPDSGIINTSVPKWENGHSFKLLFGPLMLCIMAAIVLQGMLRDGVTTWMPSFISETYDMSNRISILTGVILPVFGIFSFQIASAVYRKKITNPLSCAGLFFAVGVGAALGLIVVFGKNAMLSVLFSALLIGSMHGVNLMLIAMLPIYFQKYGNVSTVSGVLNSCTYVGSAISTYGIALLSEEFGWRFTLSIWLLVAAAGSLLCLMCIKPWNRQHGNI